MGKIKTTIKIELIDENSLIIQKPLKYNFDDLNEFKIHIDELLKNNYTYLLDEDNDYKMLLFYILKNIDVDSRRIIYDKLMMHEIIETMTVGWSELIIYDDNDLDYLFDDLELYRDQ